MPGACQIGTLAHAPVNTLTTFGPSRWFTLLGRRLIWDGLRPVRDRYGHTPNDLARVAIQYALATAPAAVALIGFRTAAQITTTAQPCSPLTPAEIIDLATIGAHIRATPDDVFRLQPAHNSIGRPT